jgi:hypothetical protein
VPAAAKAAATVVVTSDDLVVGELVNSEAEQLEAAGAGGIGRQCRAGGVRGVAESFEDDAFALGGEVDPGDEGTTAAHDPLHHGSGEVRPFDQREHLALQPALGRAEPDSRGKCLLEPADSVAAAAAPLLQQPPEPPVGGAPGAHRLLDRGGEGLVVDLGPIERGQAEQRAGHAGRRDRPDRQGVVRRQVGRGVDAPGRDRAR